MVTDIHDSEIDKRQQKIIQRLKDPPEYSSKNSSWQIQKNSVTICPEFLPQSLEVDEPSSYFLVDKS